MIRFDKVNKLYGDVQTLKDVSLRVEKAELVSLIGPSGCGKTTTLRMVNRLIEATSGKIYVQGRDISAVNPVELRRGIGYVIQQVGLLPHLSIGKNIGLVPKLKGMKEAQYSRRIDELLDRVGLDSKAFRNRFPAELSGGQQQRVGVIRALAAEPPIILMDEPFSALDPISREQLQDELVKLQKTIHKTILFVTHDMDEALKISDRIAIMNKGEIVQFDTPQAILKNPANAFVRGFIGEKRLSKGGRASLATIEDVLIPQGTAVTPERLIADVAALAERDEMEAVLVTDGAGRPVGYVLADDLRERRDDGRDPVASIVRRDVQAFDSTADWKNAAEHLTNSGDRAVAVLNEGKAIGLATEKSILKRLMRL